MRYITHPVIGALGVFMTFVVAHAQEDTARFPSRPVRLVITHGAGGGNDFIGRLINQRLTERLGRSFIAENKVGADGIIATDYVAKSPADGYTLLLPSSSYTTNAAVHNLPYDPLKSLTGIAMLAQGPIIIAVSSVAKIGSLKDLIAQARAKPGHISYASSGLGGINNFSAELFNGTTGIHMTHVPYKAGAQGVTDVISGQPQVLVSTLAVAISQVRSGRLKVLAIGSQKRSALLPDVPTVIESGVPGYESSIWWGILAPAGVPEPIADKMNAEITSVLREPEIARRLSNEAAEPWVMSREEFQKIIVSDIAKWTRVAKEAGIKFE